jgi:hypothetical protein
LKKRIIELERTKLVNLSNKAKEIKKNQQRTKKFIVINGW